MNLFDYHAAANVFIGLIIIFVFCKSDVAGDVDECTLMTDNCDDNAICQNTVGSFTCTCADGYSGDGVVCTDSEPPSIECPDDIYQTSTEINMTALALKSNVDNSGESSRVKLSPCINNGDEFSRGTTHYTYTATDGAGNNATCSFTVKVKKGSSNKSVIIGCTVAAVIILLIIIVLMLFLRYDGRSVFDICFGYHEDTEKIQEKNGSHVNGAYTG